MVVEIVNTYKDLRKVLENMDSSKMSISALEILNKNFDGKLPLNDPYKKYENKKWCVHEEKEIIWVQPYEIHCKNYLEKG